MAEVQSYNSNNKCWVKRDKETGKITGSSPEKYDGIPEKKTAEDSQDREAKKVDNNEDSSGSFSFFEWY